MVDDVSEVHRRQVTPQSKYRNVIQLYCTNGISTSEAMKLSFLHIFGVS